MNETPGGRHQDAFGAVVRSGYWREKDARVVLEAWRGSGLEPEEFARRHRLSPRRVLRFTLWRWAWRSPLRADRRARTAAWRCLVRGGRRIAVGRDFDEGVLARVVRVVESLDR